MNKNLLTGALTSQALLIGIGVLLAVVIAGIYFAGSPKPQPSLNPSAPVKAFAISAKEYAFTPATITVNKGDNVKITFTNNGTFSHNLTLTELGVKTNTIAPGESATLEFSAAQAGSFEFHCSVDGHRDLGMQGTLVVQ